jgi:hypothetical protein
VDAPRRPAPFHRVLWRELVLLSPKLGAAAAFIALTVLVPTATGGERPAHDDNLAAFLTVILPLWWPAAVWGVGSRPSRRRVEPLPVGALAQQLGRLAAGALWLEVILFLALAAPAVGLGSWIPPLDPGNPATWMALPAAALLLYLLASPPALLGTDNWLLWYVGWVAFLLPVLPMSSILPQARFSLGSALSVVARNPGPWAEAMVLWIALFTAVAVLAAEWSVEAERSAPSPLR